ncbi:hypothetical protein KKG72_02180 [bacterium]|nr:hypothetical protein [bacterium]MBU1995031.1 hypothetical protein [bacterium]
MKALKLSATLMLLGTLTLGMAEVSVDTEIDAIQNATPQTRVGLVNEFKQTLSTLSAEDRAAAIEQFKASMQANGKELKTMTQTQTQTQTKTQTRERNRVNQMEQTSSMQRTQQMNQHQTASNVMQTGRTGQK